LSIFEKISNALPESNISSEVYYKFMICFDYESSHEKSQEFDSIDSRIDRDLEESKGGKTYFISVHRPLSVSVVSNVPGFEEAKHFVNRDGEIGMIRNKIDYMYEIQSAAREIMWKEHGEALVKLINEKIEFLKEKSKEFSQSSSQFDHGCYSGLKKDIESYLLENNCPLKPNRPMPRKTRKRKRRQQGGGFLDNECGVDGPCEKENESDGDDSESIGEFIDNRSYISDNEERSDLNLSDEENIDLVSTPSRRRIVDSDDDDISNSRRPRHYVSDYSDSGDECGDNTCALSQPHASQAPSTPLESDVDITQPPPHELPSLDDTPLLSGKKGKIPVVSNFFDNEIEKLEELIKGICHWCSEIPVLGFNSQKYDLKLIKHHLHNIMSIDENGEKCSVRMIDSGKGVMSLQNARLKFLDVTNYLSPGTSLAKFLEQSECSMKKSFFPYEHITSPDVLYEQTLPSKDKWFSVLKGQSVLGSTEEEIDSNYKHMQDVWEEQGMSSLFDLLRYYNNIDVIPFLEACEKLAEQYHAKKIDPFKMTVSSPGVSMYLGMRSAEENGYLFPLINDENQDFHHLIQDNIVGGPSIVFNHCAIAGETVIKRENCDENFVVQNILGFDCNSMYPGQLADFLPVQCWYRRKASENFKARRMDGFNMSAVEFEYMQSINDTRKKNGRPPVKTRSDNGGKELSVCGIFVDGLSAPLEKEEDVEPSLVESYKRTLLCSEGEGVTQWDRHFKPTAFLVNGCYHHGHHCKIDKLSDKYSEASNVSEKVKLARQINYLMKKREESLTRIDILRKGGYYVHCIYECEWKKQLTLIRFADVDNANKVKPYGVLNYGTKKNSLTESKIIELLKSPLDKETGSGLFGLIRCDVEVPEDEYSRWDEMGPIFINATIDEQDLSQYQLDRYFLTPGLKPGAEVKIKKKLLIDCLKVEGGHGLFSTELLRWWLKKGLVITKIYEVFEACAGRPFKNYIDSVVEERKAGDTARRLLKDKVNYLSEHEGLLPQSEIDSISSEIVDCKKTIAKADRSKVTMNSFYGKMLERKSRHTQSEFVQGYASSCVAASRPGLKSHVQLDRENDLFEIKRSKRRISWNIPTYLGICVLQMAKLILLQFMYDFIYKYHDFRKLMGMECDTDAYYLAIAGESLRDALWSKEDMTDENGDFISIDGYESYDDYLEKYRLAEEKFLSLSSLTQRVPNLFKLEWSGKRMVCLGSKSYAGNRGSGCGGLKFSAKGVQARLNKSLLNVDTYLKIHKEGGVEYVKQSGFRMSNRLTERGKFSQDNERMTTYKGSKIGLNGGSYYKRYVSQDGSTRPHRRSFQIEKGPFFLKG